MWITETLHVNKYYRKLLELVCGLCSALYYWQIYGGELEFTCKTWVHIVQYIHLKGCEYSWWNLSVLNVQRWTFINPSLDLCGSSLVFSPNLLSFKKYLKELLCLRHCSWEYLKMCIVCKRLANCIYRWCAYLVLSLQGFPDLFLIRNFSCLYFYFLISALLWENLCW